MEILKAAWATTCCCCPHPMLLFRISAYLDLISIFPQETVMINFLRRRNMKRHYCHNCLGLDHQQVESVLDQDELLLLREPQELDLGHQAVRQC